MRPKNLKTKIFLDSGDPSETKETLKLLGFLDGQTTNPSLISKNPEVIERLGSEKKFSKDEINVFYKEVVCEISSLIPQGSISIEVYADDETTEQQMLDQAKMMNKWIRNAHIKLPANIEGLKAANIATKLGIRVNMTLCFIEAQSAAVYSATKDGQNVYISPFVGRIDDAGENGMQYVENTIRLYKKGDRHVKVLAASIRTLDHLLQSFKLKVDIVTAPLKVYKEWVEMDMNIPDDSYIYPKGKLKDISFRDYDLEASFGSFTIDNPLLKVGLIKFAQDWNKLVE
ncbi:transaldolase [Candidatus Roizmanbacteria bacterium RIFCSPHIGHO2_02_FULL_37_13b]|nr:MAG: transaldolase [Candidatus Roizmanbacteria bacterium RIFCSPHIGHO2_02_FULL_37_13b]